MADITAQMVRELREKSGAGMMDCKKALTETDGDFEAAFDHLRTQGLKKADKKAGRTTGEGRVYAVIEGGKVGGMVAVSCETDFVAKTPDFEKFMQDLCTHVIANDPADVEEFNSQSWQGESQTAADAVKATIGRLGENIQVSKVARFENSGGYVVSYVHHDDKKGALVSVTTSADADKASMALKDLCMHIVVFNPDGLERDEVAPETIERERAVYLEEVKDKPEAIQEKIVTGKLEKFFSANILTEQPWVKDDKLSVQKALEQALGAGTKIERFERFEVGAG